MKNSEDQPDIDAHGSLNFAFRPPQDPTGQTWFDHSSAQRVNTDAIIAESLRRQYPDLHLTVSQQATCDLLAFASAGHAIVTPISNPSDSVTASLKWRQYIPPGRRLDNGKGALVDIVKFAKYMYKWRQHEFVLYVIDGRDGMSSYPIVRNNYILSETEHYADDLIVAASIYGQQLHNEVWVFDGGFWRKDRELYESVVHSSWEDVILDEDMKKALIKDVSNFFDKRDTYSKLKVPWKRGVIYYGPPGNGKTISIKAMMHALYSRKDPVPTLYVRTLTSFQGPEYSIKAIFTKARQEAPCYLVFEDLDSIVRDNVRSYFLNEVDGLRSNDGILMVGSTNHLDRLDPGIAKRPSRFDRKYFFPNPDFEQRVQYAQYWRRKLSDADEIEFPEMLCPAIAKITEEFSFAYMQEAFVATLLTIAAYNDTPDPECWNHKRHMLMWTSVAQQSVQMLEDNDDLNKLLLWREMKKQVKILKEEMKEHK